MPIRFRCGHCSRLLSIGRRKAGSETSCPHCSYILTVPDDPGDSSGIEDLDELLNPHPASESGVDSHSGHRSAPPEDAKVHPSLREAGASSYKAASSTESSRSSRKKSKPSTRDTLTAPDDDLSGENPALEPDVADFQKTAATNVVPYTFSPDLAAATGTVNIDEQHGQIVLSVQKATLLAIAVVILVGLSFVAGYLLGSSQ
jgi:hypothetical protein